MLPKQLVSNNCMTI